MTPTPTVHLNEAMTLGRNGVMRPTWRPWSSCAAALLLGIALSACGGGGGGGDGPTPPPLGPGSVRTTVTTTGGDPDLDGYDLFVGSAGRQSLSPNGTVIVEVPSGTHSLRVERVDANCSVTGPNPRTVTVPPGTLVDVAIQVVCATTGLEITVRTTGAEYAASHYISLNNKWVRTVGPNASAVMTRMQPGTYTVSLGLPGDHCQISGSQPLTVEVKSKSVTSVSFDVACVAPVRVERIAYSDFITVEMVKPDGTGATAVVSGYSPSWSPDGAQLVYSDLSCDYYSYDCSGGLAVVNPETRSVRRLDKAQGYDPAWAPIGDEIAFINTSGLLTVTTQGTTPAVRILDPRYAGSPSWSPDGQRIAFGCYSSGDTDVCVINKDGTKAERLVPGSTYDSDPAWGPHGRVAFTRRISQTRTEIFILETDGRTTSIAVGMEPAWSRDGTKIVFAGTGGIFIVDSDGKNLRRLTTGSHTDPAWRP